MLALHNGENKAEEPFDQEYFQMSAFCEMFIEISMGLMGKVPDVLEAYVPAGVQLLCPGAIEVPDITAIAAAVVQCEEL